MAESIDLDEILNFPSVRERTTPAGSHASPRLHWRRGHYRNQAYGPGRIERKIIWIEPALIGGGDD